MAVKISRQALTYFLFAGVISAGMACQASQAQISSDGSDQKTSAGDQKILSRHYQEGEKLSYHMKGANQDRRGTLHYEIQADGTVKKNTAGQFVEEFGWSNLIVDGKPTLLSPASSAFRQVVSLDPGYTLSVPNLSRVDPILIGPITDLLTFYADMQVAEGQGSLTHAGDHFYFKHGDPSSWADGNYALIGEDSIDFDVTLSDLNSAEKTATILVRHVPPAQPEVALPAAWMHAPVANTPNNWVQVTKNFASKSATDKYAASVGKETFDVQIKISMADGKIISGSIDNPLEVLERDCASEALTTCGDPVRYKIYRQVEIQ